MHRTKWVRLIVRDLGDAIRWANLQQARHIGDFRYRMINGHESVSFRLYPEYAIQIGTRDIVVVCHVAPSRWHHLARWLAHRADAIGTAIAPRLAVKQPLAAAASAPARSAEICAFPELRQSAHQQG